MLKQSLIAFTALCALAATAAAKECAPPRLANSLAMEDLPDGTMAVAATVDGQPETLLVGIADISQLWNSEAVKLRLAVREGRRTMDAAGRFSEDIAPIESFRVGSMRTGYFYAQVSPDPDVANAQTDGVLGNDMMQRYDIDLDFAHRRLNFFSPEHCEGAGLYWTTSAVAPVKMVTYADVVYVPVILDGHTIVAALDTTADKTFLNPEVAQRLFGLKADSLEPVAVTDSGGLIKAGMHRFEGLAIGQISFRDPDIAIPFDTLTESTREFHASHVIANRYSLSRILPDMVIGMDVLKKTHLYISFQNQRVYLSPATEGEALKAGPVKTSWFNVWRYGYDPYFFYRHPFVHF